jgi:5-methylcytosine-specific restriction endonuclease McrA
VRETVDECLYVIGWNDRVKRADFESADFDNRILLRPDVGTFLVELAGVVRPLVHHHWVSMVTRLNGLQDSRLEEFLFGRDRTHLAPVCAPLLELQSGRCFYCERGIQAKPQVDHFLPWARHPDDGIENLVVAHSDCNRQKSDFLADAGHVGHWAERVGSRTKDLAAIAEAARWDRDARRTVSVVRAIYRNLPNDVRLWTTKGKFAPIDHGAVDLALLRVSAVA